MSKRGRPPLAVGEHGTITVSGTAATGYRARGRLRLSDGRTVQVEGDGPTAKAARKALGERVAWRKKGSGAGLTPDSTVKSLVEQWLSFRRDVADISTRSLDEYTAVLRVVITPRIGALRIGEATPGIVNATVVDVGKTQPGRAKHVRTILKQAFAFAVLQGALTASPVHDLTPLSATSTKEVVALGDTEVAKLRTTLATWVAGDPRRSPDVARIFDLMLATGCRIGEVLALRWKDVDLASTPATIHVAATETLDSDGGHHVSEARKGRARRAGERGLTYTLPRWAAAMLLEQRVAAGAVEWVFPARGGGLRSQTNVRRSLREALAGTEFEGQVTPHVMRKTVGTAVADELGVATASKQLGHRSEAVTKRHYVAVAPTTPAEAADVLERFAPKKPTGGADAAAG